MSLHISISPQAEALLRKRAEAAGKSPDALASEILEFRVRGRSKSSVAPSRRSFTARA